MRHACTLTPVCSGLQVPASIAPWNLFLSVVTNEMGQVVTSASSAKAGDTLHFEACLKCFIVVSASTPPGGEASPGGIELCVLRKKRHIEETEASRDQSGEAGQNHREIRGEWNSTSACESGALTVGFTRTDIDEEKATPWDKAVEAQLSSPEGSHVDQGGGHSKASSDGDVEHNEGHLERHSGVVGVGPAPPAPPGVECFLVSEATINTLSLSPTRLLDLI